MARLPAALMLLLAAVAPPSLTFRSTSRAAVRVIAPDPTVVRLLVDPMRMSRPESSVRLAPVVCRLPLIWMSLVPRVARRSAAAVLKAPKLKVPRLRVRSRLPVGLKVPPVRLKSLVTVMLPVPPSEPADRFTTGATSAVPTLSAPPVMPSVVPGPMVNRPETASEPPDSTRFSSDSTCSRLKLPALRVTVWLPATLMRTRWPAVGAKPVLQLASVDQSPLPPIQQSSTAQPLWFWNTAEVRP